MHANTSSGSDVKVVVICLFIVICFAWFACFACLTMNRYHNAKKINFFYKKMYAFDMLYKKMYAFDMLYKKKE